MSIRTQAELEAWLLRRETGIGASEADVIMGTSPFQTAFALWARRLKLIPAQPRTSAMQRGIELEPIARRAYEALHGVKMPADELTHPSIPFIRANFDGINREAQRVLEIKCPGPPDHATAKAGMIPEKYFWQCVHLMGVAGLPELHYFSFDGTTGVTVVLRRNVKLETILFQAESVFWQCLQEKIPPAFEIPYLGDKNE